MGWYGDGARRLACRKEVGDALERFTASLPTNIEMKDYATNLKDNSNYDWKPMILDNPMSQASLIADLNKATKGNVAVAIAFSHCLENLDKVSDKVCKRIQGIFFFSSINIKQDAFRRFIRRCPNIKSLTMAYTDEFDERFLESLFQERLLPKLEFLEVSNASNEAIAAMYTAPNLQEIVFRWPDPCISNKGFGSLIENGGGANLTSIWVCILTHTSKSTLVHEKLTIVPSPLVSYHRQGGILHNDMSKTLSKNFLMAALPKFAAGKAFASDLKHISMGKKVNYVPTAAGSKKAPPVVKDQNKDRLPFAVVPVERMSHEQLRNAVKNRGLPMPKPMSTVNFRNTLIEHGFTIEEEEAIQNDLHIYSLLGDISKLEQDKKKIQAKMHKIVLSQNKSPDKLYPDLTKGEMVKLVQKYGGVPTKYNRDEVARVLHKKMHQGGGSSDIRFELFQTKLGTVQQELDDAKRTYTSLEATREAKGWDKKKTGKPSVATAKRPLATVN